MSCMRDIKLKTPLLFHIYLSPVSFFAGGELLFFKSVDSRLSYETLSVNLMFDLHFILEHVQGEYLSYLSGLPSVEWCFTT